MSGDARAVWAELDFVLAVADGADYRARRRDEALQMQVEALVGVVDETADRLARLAAPATGTTGTASEPPPTPPACLIDADDVRRQATTADAAWIVNGWRDDGWQT